MTAKRRNNRRITQGGQYKVKGNPAPSGNGTDRLPDIIIQMPELFYFDIQKFINSVRAAKTVEYSARNTLFDIYESILMDSRLRSAIRKRQVGITRIPIEFQRDGEPDEKVNSQIQRPWFKKFEKDVLDSKFWGFSAMQFFMDEEGFLNYELIPRKHYDPVNHMVLQWEGDMSGTPVESFPDILEICEDKYGLGDFVALAPLVLYKRGNIGDWAQFCQIFGMPIREYTYDAGDEEARLRLLKDARKQGATAVYIHPKGSEMTLIESSNKSGSVDVYKIFNDTLNEEITIGVLGNTLTTSSGHTGTQALGTVHQEEEDELKEDDRDYILDILNFGMKKIFLDLGINTEGGTFVYKKNNVIDTSKQADIVVKMNSVGLPISDDYLYKTFGIEKPDNYEELKARKEAEEQQKKEEMEAMRQQIEGVISSPPQKADEGKKPKPPKPLKTGTEAENNFWRRLFNFFAEAPWNRGKDGLAF